MADPVLYPHAAAVRRRGGVFVPPLLIAPFILYNLIAFTAYRGTPDGWNNPFGALFMISGASWEISAGDLMLLFGLACLFIEILKSTRTGSSSVLEHMLSTVVFVLFLIEFLLIGAAASSVFFLLMIMSLVDLVAGFTVSITSAGRDVTMSS